MFSCTSQYWYNSKLARTKVGFYNRSACQTAPKQRVLTTYVWLSPLHLTRSIKFMLSKNHTQEGLLHAALAVWTIIDNLQSVESIASLDIFSSRSWLLYWRSVCGHLSRQNHYGDKTAWRNTERIRKHWTLSNVRIKSSVCQKIVNWDTGDPCTILWP